MLYRATEDGVVSVSWWQCSESARERRACVSVMDVFGVSVGFNAGSARREKKIFFFSSSAIFAHTAQAENEVHVPLFNVSLPGAAPEESMR